MSLVAGTCERVFRDCALPQAIALDPESGEWRGALWSALEETGLATAWVPEEAGGAGASVREGFEALRAAGRHAAAAPLADTLVAGLMLARAGLDVPAGKLAVAPVRSGDRIRLRADGILSGRAGRVPFGREAEHVAVIARAGGGDGGGRGDGSDGGSGGGGGYRVALVERARCGLVEESSLAGDPLDHLDFEGVAPLAVGGRPVARDEARLFGAASRALIAGALQAILDLSVDYSRERVAFERPIAKFQAVQQELARLAGEAAAANAAANSAAWALENHDAESDAVLVEVASAKVRAGEAAHARRPHRAPGARGHRLLARARAASLHASALGVARRVRGRERVGAAPRRALCPPRGGRHVARPDRDLTSGAGRASDRRAGVHLSMDFPGGP